MKSLITMAKQSISLSRNIKILCVLFFQFITCSSQESKLYSFYCCHDFYNDYSLFLVHNKWTYESGGDSTAYMYVAGYYIENGFYTKRDDTLCLYPKSVLISIDVPDYLKQDTCILYEKYIESKDYEYKNNRYWKLLVSGDSLSIVLDSINNKDFNGFGRFPTLNKLKKQYLKQTNEEKTILEFRNRNPL